MWRKKKGDDANEGTRLVIGHKCFRIDYVVRRA